MLGDRMNNKIKRMIPYLEAATGNISEINNKMRKRTHDIMIAEWWNEIGLDELQSLRDEMLEELLELDEVLCKAEKLIRPKES